MKNKQPDLGTKTQGKGPKKGEYRQHRLKIGLTDSELSEWAGMAAKAGFRPLAQKLFKEHKQSGNRSVDVRGIGEFVREAAVPDYKAHAWEREMLIAAARKKIQEGENDLRRLGAL